MWTDVPRISGHIKLRRAYSTLVRSLRWMKFRGKIRRGPRVGSWNRERTWVDNLVKSESSRLSQPWCDCCWERVTVGGGCLGGGRLPCALYHL